MIRLVHIAASFFLLVLLLPEQAFAADNISRRDGFLLIWQSTSRPAQATSEKPFTDVPKGDIGFAEITYAKARGLLDDDDPKFYPDEPLSPSVALLWLFRTRSVERIADDGGDDLMKLPDLPDVAALAKRYRLEYDATSTAMTKEELLTLMQLLDKALVEEVHESSLYSEKFHGKGTAFGESFDMYALTAAHRTYPHNTLVRVTNIANGKSVVVRINDRGPFVQGRDMDLSLASFTTIAERSLGKINVRFERLGDVNVVRRCADERRQVRITRDVRLSPGIPHSFELGGTLRLRSTSPFVLRDLQYPDGTRAETQTWVTKDETYEFIPSVEGYYQFRLGTKEGRSRMMGMEVVRCD